MEVFMGIDVGSVSTNIAVLDAKGDVLDSLYIRTQGRPIDAVQDGIRTIKNRMGEICVKGIGTTGSGRQLAGLVVSADTVKNEITAHAVAAMNVVPDVQTVLEIGGQDSKIIIVRNGVVSDFAMNTVCAAGTGSFLDQQAARLNVPIEKFGAMALESLAPVRIAGRCAVFAESDMIHKQQTGYTLPDIVHGLCQALVRNYLNNVGKGKVFKGPIVFQGGVAANQGMQKAFSEALGIPVFVPPHFGVMGAIGAALLAQEKTKGVESRFRGFHLIEDRFSPRSFECGGCPNMCEVIEMNMNDKVVARWGDRCGKWTNATNLQ